MLVRSPPATTRREGSARRSTPTPCKLSPDDEIYLQTLSQADGAVDVRRSGSSGFWEPSMISKGGYDSNTGPKHPATPENLTCG